MDINRKVIVFSLEHYNPLGLIRSLGENGIKPIYIAVKRRGDITSKSKYIDVCHKVDSIEEGYVLLQKLYGCEQLAPYVILSDDDILEYCDLRYDEMKERFVCFNAGVAGRICKYMDKKIILDLAHKHGFNVIDSWVVNKGEIPKDLDYPIITKDINPNSGSWKSDVYICNNEEELRVAYEKIVSPVILIQKFINKKNELALEGFSISKGKEILIVTAMTWKYLIQGYYSPYHNVTMFKDKEMQKKLQAMFEEIGFDGIFEVEFIIDQDETIYFLEINFRASAWNYSGSCAGMPLSYLWVKSMENGYIDKHDRKDFEDFTSMSEVIDFGKRVDTRMITLPEWLKDFKEAKCTYYYNKDDIQPFLALKSEWDKLK